MLQVHVNKELAGNLCKSSDGDKHYFSYQETCPLDRAVSLTMSVGPEYYASDYKTLHPIFDMNLPEGALADRLRKEFSKIIPSFDAMALLKIVGKSQIGRLSYAMPGDNVPDIPAENLNDLLAHDGAEGLFESLLNRYAVHSGISGAMPKVMIRSDEASHITYRGTTHILKAWTDEYPHLAENEYFCMRAALHAKLEVPQFELSQGGKFLLVERFDLRDGRHLGFEDFCVLNGLISQQKYDGSYESVTKRIKDFVSGDLQPHALESFFRSLLLSCVLRNGDAHLKNFGVLYDNTEGIVKWSPTYDIVTTTVYHSADTLALTLGGSKRWPKPTALMNFAMVHCGLGCECAEVIVNDVMKGVHHAADEMMHYMELKQQFKSLGKTMLSEWNKGLSHSIQI